MASATHANSRRPSPARSCKRQRNSDSPLFVWSAACAAPETFRETRRLFFDALGKGDSHPGMRKPILSANHLSEVQLSKCFEILHACGVATDVSATRATTRQSIESFLDAVFNNWTSDMAGDLLRPEMEFLVEAEVVAGRVCSGLPGASYQALHTRRPVPAGMQSSLKTHVMVASPVAPSHHSDMSACSDSGICKADVYAVATYSCNPAMLKLEFSMVDPFTKQPESLCPMGRRDIRWITADWQKALGETLQGRIVSKMHKFNKHLAIWQARKLIHAWSNGSVSMGPDAGDMGFVRRDAASMATMGFGREKGV